MHTCSPALVSGMLVGRADYIKTGSVPLQGTPTWQLLKLKKNMKYTYIYTYIYLCTYWGQFDLLVLDNKTIQGNL